MDVADESDLVKVSWDPIPFSNDFGDITYQIKLQSPNGPPIVVITPDTRKAIDGLKRQTTYTLTVAAINSMGSGPSSAEVAFSISQPTPKPGMCQLWKSLTFLCNWTVINYCGYIQMYCPQYIQIIQTGGIQF